MRTATIIGGAMAMTACLAATAQAHGDTNEVRRLTFLTFSGPVQLPYATLPAGKYRFEIPDLNEAPHVVRVSSADGKTVYTTFQTAPKTMANHDLSQQTTVLMFSERPAGLPQAVKEWYYPGRSIGEEFMYPKNQATLIAQANCTSVLSINDGMPGRVEGCGMTTATQTVAETTTTTSTVAENQVAENQLSENQIAENQAAGNQSVVDSDSNAIGTSGQTTNEEHAASRRRLPRTASPLALIELLSGLSFAGAFGVRKLRSRAV